MRFGIVVSKYNQGITQNLLDGALLMLTRHKVSSSDITVVWVPGAFEIPLAVQKLAQSGKFAAVIALGCVLKGETSHNQHISESVAHALMQVGLKTGVPVTFGVLTPNTRAQAKARSGKGSANKGTEAAEAAMEMAVLMKGLKI